MCLSVCPARRRDVAPARLSSNSRIAGKLAGGLGAERGRADSPATRAQRVSRRAAAPEQCGWWGAEKGWIASQSDASQYNKSREQEYGWGPGVNTGVNMIFTLVCQINVPVC